MSVRAGLWSGLPDFDSAEHRYRVVACPADVDLLIEALGVPGCNDATLEHFGRDTDDEGECDHSVVLAVRGAWGYLHYVDPDFSGWPVGDERAPHVNEAYTDFPPGVGVPLEVLRALVLEFLETARRPDAVRWYTEADLFPSWRTRRSAIPD
ncbi:MULTISPECIES: Imm1 family immunity protein [Actinosynnema]|nr:Imm1 family immunity protein [Actinosynnema pretiosum]